ncbi:MAG: hypothetical protein NWE84_05375 [Candidatus Bathyarchaeota archaeon]|nr:hypothetical protein [Candidatus Bathyarchaeota archaeon]
MKNLPVVFIIAIIGLIFLVGGVGATVNRNITTIVCEACGMEIEKADVSTLLVVSADGAEHWACCPICADVVGLYYENAVIQGQCFACGQDIDVHLEDSQLSYVEFSGNKEFIKVLVGGNCMKNKLVCSGACAQSVHQSYDWATDIPEKSLQEALMMGSAKLETMTVGYKPLSIPALNYVMIGIGTTLLVAAPIAWKLVNKGPKTQPAN